MYSVILEFAKIFVGSIILLQIARVIHKLLFWRRVGVRGPIPFPLFGNWFNCIFGFKHPAEQTKHFYEQYNNEKVVGIFQNHTPRLIIRDRNLIKDILIKDFESFSERGVQVHENVEPLSHHLFTMGRDFWQPIKTALLPAFNVGKLKESAHVILNIAEEFSTYVETVAQASSEVNCIDAFTRFMNEVLGKWGLQLEMNQFDTESTVFREINNSRRSWGVYNATRRLLRENLPGLYKYSSKLFRNNVVISYYVNKLKSIEQYRKCTGDDLKDYAGLLLQFKNETSKIGERCLSDELTAAQIYLLFTAGAESTALVISKAIYEIAKSDLIQNTLRDEIKRVFEKSDGTIFEKLKVLKYLNQVFKETLRKYPLRNIIRVSTKPYTFRGTNVKIPAGTNIIVPLYGLHRDPEIFQNPNVFDPERFDTEMKNQDLFSIPFGLGPRYCIGSKLAEVTVKIILVVILKKFKLKIDDGYTLSKNYTKKTFLEPIKGIKVKFERYSQ
ncbi:hypothetical protein QAD02_008649 [Eretmocerus hayati]|uniref:Uncharacterized protein n=1 Tax=Eretmocerus hayati TaxID=131215 RepID=A0ACC2N9G1_9HYME|nr:hypothetical protein QAD02_008649 [Eretmocerus hayati]